MRSHAEFIRAIAANMANRAEQFQHLAQTFQGLPADLNYNLPAVPAWDAETRARKIARADELRQHAARFLASHLARAIARDRAESPAPAAPAEQFSLFFGAPAPAPAPAPAF